MLKKKRQAGMEERKKDRRKPGDQRFPGRLVGKVKGRKRQGDRRKGDRRQK